MRLGLARLSERAGFLSRHSMRTQDQKKATSLSCLRRVVAGPFTPTGPEFCQLGRAQLIEKSEAFLISLRLQRLFKEKLTLSLAVLAEMTRLLIVAKF